MKKKFFVRILCMVILIFSIVIVLFNTYKVSGKSVKEEFKIVTVKENDTLWSIAKENCKSNSDIRKAVYYIRKTNNITSANITPGQEIKIPSELY